jgi:hypothetical protein
MKPPPWVMAIVTPLTKYGTSGQYTLDRKTALKLSNWILTGTLAAGLWLQE